MGQLTFLAMEEILKIYFQNDATIDIPETLYIGLAYSAISPDDTLATIDEENDDNYERQGITFTDPAESVGIVSIENNDAILFPANDALGNWISWGFITDAETGTSGKILATIEWDAAKQAPAGESIEIPIGEVKIHFQGGGE